MTHKPYPKYKDSGVEWIGQIPEHWETSVLKNIANVELSNIDKKSYEDQQPVYLCNYTDVYYNDQITEDLKFMKATATDQQIRKFKLKRDDVIITKDSESPNDIAIPTWVQEDLNNVVCGYHLSHITPTKKLEGKYLYYMLSSIRCNNQFSVLANGVTRYGISKGDIMNSLYALPSINEQRKIVCELDEKINSIKLIEEKKEKQIQLLEEKRQAVITEAVTKGLDPNVPMKDSGVEWIGEIPAHWEVSKIKYLTNHPLSYGANESAEDENRDHPRYIRITDIDESGNLKDDTFKSINPKIAEKYPVYKGDILFARSGATVGKSYIHEKKEVDSYAGYLIKFRANPAMLRAHYFYYFTLTPLYWNWLNSIQIQATIENVSAEKYRNLRIPLPPVEEQKKIIVQVNSEIMQINSIIGSIKNQIQKLRSYRESLIYEAVTGKIDLR